MHRILKENKKLTLLISSLFFVVSMFSFVSIYLQFEVFKFLFSDPNKNLQKFLILQFLSFFFEFIYWVLQPILEIAVDKQAAKILINIKNKRINNVANFKPKQLRKLGQSEIIYDLETNTNDYYKSNLKNFYVILFNVLTFVFLVLFLIIQSIVFSKWVLIILVLIFTTILFSFVIPKIYINKNKKINQEFINTKSKNLSFFAELTKGYKYFYSHNLTKVFEQKSFDSLHKISKTNLKYLKKRRFAEFVESALNNFVNQMLFISTVLLSILNPINNLILLILNPIFEGLKYSSETVVERRKDFKLLKPLEKNFQKYDDYLPKPFEQKFKTVDQIVFHNFNLKLEESQNMLYKQNLSFEFKMGEKYFISGNSGTGKSTIVKTLIKENDNFIGTVLINNINIEKLSEENIYQNLIYVDNLATLFSGTVKEVITFFDHNIDELKLKFAIEKSLIDFDLNSNYEDLSTGQKQRVKIAWSFYYDKKIIIFDEALSNIDKKTSLEIEENILKLNNILFINISHYPNKINEQKYHLIKL